MYSISRPKMIKNGKKRRKDNTNMNKYLTDPFLIDLKQKIKNITYSFSESFQMKKK